MNNYHFWSNLVIASLVRVFRLPLFPAQFHFFPLLISYLLGFSTVAFWDILNFNKVVTRFLVFLNYFGGDLIYLLLIFLKRGPNYFIMSSLEDGTKFLYNPPRAFSLIIALAGISIFSLWLKSKKDLLGFLSIFLLASTIGFKIYTSLFFVPGIFFLALISLFRHNWKKLFILATFPLIAILIYLPTNSQAGGLIWTPFSIVNNFIVQPSLGLESLERARIIFLNDKKYLHNLIFEIVFTGIFLIGILGTKILGFFQSVSFVVKKLGKELTLLLITGIFSSLFVGLFFIQVTGGANTFNFLVSVFFFLSIFASLSISFWKEKLPKYLFWIFIILIIILTTPRVTYETFHNLKNFFNPRGFLLTNEELELYKLINNQSLSFHKTAIDPMHWLGRNTPYVSLFLNQPLIVSGNGLLKHFRIDISKEEKSQSLIFNNSNEVVVAKELFTNQIGHIVLYENHSLRATESAYFTTVLAKNNAGAVLKVNRERLLERLNFFKIQK